MRLFFSISLIFVFSSIAVGFGSRGSKYPEHFENTKWDASKPPVVEEPPVKNQVAVQAWQRAIAEPSPFCDSEKSLHATDGSRLEAVGVKEHNVEVHGAFLRFRTCLLPDGETARGQGWVEMSSWDSGLAARDRRVVRYVFGAETEGQSLTPVDLEVQPWKPGNLKQGDSWQTVVKTKATFRGLTVHNEFPAKVTRVKGGYRMVTETLQPLHFMSPVVEAGFRQMMELCNHRFLASYALVGFDLNLLPKPKVTADKIKKN